MIARLGRAIRGYALVHVLLTKPDAQPDDRGLIETVGGCNRGRAMGRAWASNLIPITELTAAMRRLADQTGHNVQRCPMCENAVALAIAEQREAAR